MNPTVNPWTQRWTHEPANSGGEPKQQNPRTQAVNPRTQTAKPTNPSSDWTHERVIPQANVVFLSFSLFYLCRPRTRVSNTRVSLLDLLQWTGVYKTRDISFLNSLKTILTNKLFENGCYFEKKSKKKSL